MDNLSSSDRKKNMRNIKSTGARSTEKILRSSLVGAGISGFKLNYEKLPGKPDFVFCKEQVVVFVDGCFWHGCPQCYKSPKSNNEYWRGKYNTNKKRDRQVDIALTEDGWAVVRIWEHELKNISSARHRVQKLLH